MRSLFCEKCGPWHWGSSCCSHPYTWQEAGQADSTWTHHLPSRPAGGKQRGVHGAIAVNYRSVFSCYGWAFTAPSVVARLPMTRGGCREVCVVCVWRGPSGVLLSWFLWLQLFVCVCARGGWFGFFSLWRGEELFETTGNTIRTG